MYWHVDVIFSQRMEFIIRTPLDRPIFAALAISTHFEIARRLEGKTARRDGGADRGVKLSLFCGLLPRNWPTCFGLGRVPDRTDIPLLGFF